MIKRIFFILFLYALFFPKVSIAQQDSIDIFIANQIKQQGITGLSLGIIKNGKIIKAKGYGLANIEMNVPTSDKTMFKIGSISKQFVAVGIMKLVEDGKLKLTDPITRFIKNAPEKWKSITIHNVLNHTAGFPLEPPQWDGMKNLADSVYIKTSFTNSLLFQAGSRYEYSNFGYFILADIIRIISNMSFSEYMRKYIFEKCDLNAIRTTSLDSIVLNRADGYEKAARGVIQNAPNYRGLRAAGAFLSDINDMLKWELIMQNNKLLTKKHWNMMWDKTIKTTLTMDNEPMYYGYGWMINNINSKQFVHHGGSMPGFRSVYFRFLDEKSAVIVLTNSNDADAYGIAFGVSDLIHKNN
jgi:CubicO group peptidase (beta-lactamase class C family)